MESPTSTYRDETCEYCGKEYMWDAYIEDRPKFCPHCGKPQTEQKVRA